MKQLIILIAFLIPTFLFSQDGIMLRSEEMPRFPGCEDLDADAEEKRKCSNQKLVEYIYTTVKYPEADRKAGVEGVAVIQFVVDKSGAIRDAKISRDLGEQCGNEALRAVKSMATADIKWRPGMESGKAVNVQFTLPVNFRLESKASSKTKSTGQ